MKKIIVCLSNSGHYPNEYREITEKEFDELAELEVKYEYLDNVPKKGNKLIDKILNRKEIIIPTILIYC